MKLVLQVSKIQNDCFFDIISYKSEMTVYFVNLIFLCIQVFTSQEYCFVYVLVSIININTLQIMIREGFSELGYTFFVPIKLIWLISNIITRLKISSKTHAYDIHIFIWWRDSLFSKYYLMNRTRVIWLC